jgi:hypothetical protein
LELNHLALINTFIYGLTMVQISGHGSQELVEHEHMALDGITIHPHGDLTVYH